MVEGEWGPNGHQSDPVQLSYVLHLEGANEALLALAYPKKKGARGKKDSKKGRLLVRLLKMNIMLTLRYFSNIFHPHLNPLSLRYLYDRYCSCHFIEGKTDTQRFSNWPKVMQEVWGRNRSVLRSSTSNYKTQHEMLRQGKCSRSGTN